MKAVIFEVILKEQKKNEYLEIAHRLKEELEMVKGVISVERFESLYTKNKILSLSFWESEEAIAQWRNTLEHREAQRIGRESIFADYRIRVADIVRDYTMNERAQAPKDSPKLR